MIFLAVTRQDVTSFLNGPSPTATGGGHADYRGFLNAVIADFEPQSTPSSSPAPPMLSRKRHVGYNGTFKIIDQLIWTDLFAMTSFRGPQDAETYWAVAAQHPWGVYVGPTTGVRRRIWREMNGLIRGVAEVRRATAAGGI